MAHLRDEYSQSSNIKSKQTRKNVIDAIEKILRHLKLIARLPKNGLAIFCGNVAGEGQQDIKLIAVEPPQALTTKLYRCDQVFILEPLQDMLKAKHVYLLLVIDRKEATLGLLEGKQIKLLKHFTSGVPGKFKAGGQSANRFKRLVEIMAKEFYKRIADKVAEIWDDLSKKTEIKGFLVGGPGPTKEHWLEESGLRSDIKRKVIAVKDLCYTDETGLRLLVEKARDELSEEEVIKEKNLVKKFFEAIARHSTRVTYGWDAVKNALINGAAELVLVSKTVPVEKIKAIKQLCQISGARLEVISTDTHEGQQFASFKVAAFLRFEIE